MVEASDGTVTFEFTYDGENKPTKVRDDTEGLEVEYAYDANGNLLWIEDTSNNKVNYYYNALNAVVAVTNGSTFATIEYATCCSLRTKLTYGNGCYTEYDYDDAKRLTKITNKKSNGTVISSWEYAYDDVGNVTSQTDSDSNVTSYTYDDTYHLTYVNYPSGSDFEYEYDAVGNRTKMYEYTSATITTTYTYDDADELTQYTDGAVTMTFTYASDGCLKTKSDGVDTSTYDWDFEGRLIAFKKNDSTLVEYGYNPVGTKRYSSDSTLGLTNHFHAGTQVLGDFDSNWTLVRAYVLGAEAIIDRTTDPDTVYYTMRDRLGSTCELVNPTETINTRYSYDVWGAPTETQLSGSVSTDYRYRGWCYDLASEHYAGTGLDYDAHLGRMNQRITMQIPEELYPFKNPNALNGVTPMNWGAVCFYYHGSPEQCADCCEFLYTTCVFACLLRGSGWPHPHYRHNDPYEYLLEQLGVSPSPTSVCAEECENKRQECLGFCQQGVPKQSCFKEAGYNPGTGHCCTRTNWWKINGYQEPCANYGCCLYCLREGRTNHDDCAAAQRACDGAYTGKEGTNIYWCGSKEPYYDDVHPPIWHSSTCDHRCDD